MKPIIEFKKQRELGDILSDTFAFLRQEFKSFLKAVFTIAGPYMLLFLLASVFYMYTIGDLYSFDIYGGSNSFSLGLVLLSMVVFLITMVLAYVFANSAALHYIKSYINNNGEVNMAEVKHDVKSSIWRFIGLGITKWLVLIFSAMLCFFPVLYFMVPMAIVYSIMVFEQKDVGDSFSHSFTLIKDEFWMTLATIIVIGMIVIVAGYAFSLPATLYSFMKLGIMSGEVDPLALNNFMDPIDILLNTVASLFQFLLNLISIVAYVFIYFNLNEKKNFTGTFEKIQSLGKSQQ